MLFKKLSKKKLSKKNNQSHSRTINRETFFLDTKKRLKFNNNKLKSPLDNYIVTNIAIFVYIQVI